MGEIIDRTLTLDESGNKNEDTVGDERSEPKLYRREDSKKNQDISRS